MGNEEAPGAPVKAVMVAIGGYGQGYLQGALSPERSDWIDVVGCVDPMAQTCGILDQVRERGIPVYDTLGEFFAKHSAELAVVSSPIHLHRPHTVEALENGCHVLCEKPVAATVQDVRAMIEARDKADRLVAVGYQWSYSDPVQAVKADLMAGEYGTVRVVRSRAIVPRNEAYYGRNDWAGGLKTASGQWILDSPINNAVAHALHNMLYLIGPNVDRAARPKNVVAELYRANDITNFDTGFMRVATQEGPTVYFTASHAVPRNEGLLTEVVCEKATLRWMFGFGGAGEYDTYKVDPPEAKEGEYPPDDSSQVGRTRKLWEFIKAIRGAGPVVCGLEAASAQNLALNGAQDSMPDIVEFPRDIVKQTGEEGKRVTYAEGLDEVMKRCFEEEKLPSELGVAWARPGREVDLANYRQFPGG